MSLTWLLLLLGLVGALLSAAPICAAGETRPIGLANMMAIECLPFLRPGVRVGYEGSIDKQGGNADWDWWLYRQGEEWVLFDVDGPGCIYSFVQHRYPSSPEPVFRFYFDGEAEARFVIRPAEFGKKHPFVEPLAGIFVGDDPVPAGRGPIWVVRTFVPMPFRKGCKITSSVKLEGFDKAKQEGGWGHVIYHTYPTSDGVETFTGQEDYSALLDLWRQVGRDPKAQDGTQTAGSGEIATISPGASATLLNVRGEGSVSSIRLRLRGYERGMLGSMWIRLRWDDSEKPAVECPIGVFFGNEFGHHDQRFLTHGMTADGSFYNYFPMPYWSSARVELVNRGTAAVAGVEYSVQVKPASILRYSRDRCGYFRASAYYPDTPVTPDRDSPIARIEGRGHVVLGHVSGRPVNDQVVSCEGDLRVYIDGSRTPAVESDGSESWGCYGWGFPLPPQCNPASGYDGDGPPLFAWSEVRVCMGDFYPFRSGLELNMEAGGRNDWPMRHSGIVFYYGQDEPGMVLTDRLDVGDEQSEQAHGYRVEGPTALRELVSFYEGTHDTTAVKDRGRVNLGASEFTVRVAKDNRGVILRRRSDQSVGRQRARVYIDGALVRERTWYYADRNPHKRWLDDEFQVPAAYTRGKEQMRIRLERAEAEGAAEWNEFHYWIFCLTASDAGSQSQ